MTPTSQLHSAIDTLRSGDLVETIRICNRILKETPNSAAALHLQGVALFQQGEHLLATNSIRQAIAIDTQQPDYFCNLGTVLQAMGDYGQACEQFLRGLQLDPGRPELHFNLGNALKLQGRFEEAVAAYSRALEFRSDYPQALNNLGNAFYEQGRLEEANSCFQKAIELNPHFADANHNLGNTLVRQERHSAAQPYFELAAQLAPERPEFLQSRFLSLSYDTGLSEEHRFQLHRRWGELVERCKYSIPNYSSVADSRCGIRIGYVSPDFREHSIASFLEPVLKHHDSSHFQVTCYANLATPDETTVRLQNIADRWRSIWGLSDSDTAELIRRDGIDILVDLAGHTAHNRLGVFARKPAPVQVTGWGYGWTTGLEAMDYRISDAVADPSGEPRCHTEELIRLRCGIHCYQPPSAAPDVVERSGPLGGHITFAAFHRHVKLNEPLLRIWSQILKGVPDSNLLFKDRAYCLSHVKEKILAMCRSCEIPEERIRLKVGTNSVQEHLATYGETDIALDSLPYNGSTTTCEALWMGVPVITLRGNSYVGRMSASLLTQVGLGEMIAGSVEEYIERTIELAADRQRLAQVRRALRNRVRNSPLCDGGGYARELERVYRELWIARSVGQGRQRRAS